MNKQQLSYLVTKGFELFAVRISMVTTGCHISSMEFAAVFPNDARVSLRATVVDEHNQVYEKHLAYVSYVDHDPTQSVILTYHQYKNNWQSQHHTFHY